MNKEGWIIGSISLITVTVVVGILLLVFLPANEEEKENPLPSPTASPNITKTLSIPSEWDAILENVDNEIKLTKEEIQEYNQAIRTKTDAFYDIINTSSLTKEEILSYINRYTLPTLPKYNGTSIITNKEIEEIKNNRNLENVDNQDNLASGLVVKRSNLRSFPSSIPFYNNNTNTQVDNLQETELLVNTPVRILHESKDQNWYFVMAPTYVGWVEKETIAEATEEDWNYFLKEDENSFAVVTDPMVTLEDTYLDMSVKLPITQLTEEGYDVNIPQKGPDGKVIKKTITLTNNQAYLGYVPYTLKNCYVQALKYQAVPYQWGGFTGGVDCSSYVANVFRTFGFQFPRNTSSQNTSVGTIIDVEGMSATQKLTLLEDHPMALLYQPGHVMLYLGKKEDQHYIIHANGSTWNVAITMLDQSSYLSKINKIVLIEK